MAARFSEPQSHLAFEALPGFFKYTDPAIDNASLPAVAPDFGLAEGLKWPELQKKLEALNEAGKAKGESYKLLFTARHGQGTHNVAEDKYGTEAWDAKWSLLTGDGDSVWGPDPPLTELGRQQGRDQQAEWKKQVARSDGAPLPSKLFASPFQRAAETLQLAYDGILVGDNSKGLVPRIMEGLRENFADRHTCDERSARSVVEARWKGWEMDKDMVEEDALFSSDFKESHDEMTARLGNTLCEIWKLSEGHDVIGITSHSGVMQSLFRAVKHDDFKPKTGGVVPLLVKATPLSVGTRPQPTHADIVSYLAPKLLDDETRASHKAQYAASEPYRHAVVSGLINDELLRKAREEIVEELRFTEKETDIYKVNQTGDLANLDGLPASEASRLESVLKVRNAIYSKEFRQWLMDVTGCGPLSAKKKDMSINDYRAGCHLLNHDDVISTRRLSYILYLPDPSEEWKPEWGGALELYPIVSRGVPANTPTTVIPPRWNQYTFFAVQPGYSFHSVEEVVHPSKSRLSISGWFHRPQPDEEGYTEEDEKREEQERKDHASAENIASKKATAPFHPYPESLAPPLPGSPLSDEDKAFLSSFLNPAYLQPKTQSLLFERFGEESHILLADLLKKDVASAIEKHLKAKDGEDGLRWWERKSLRKGAKVPDHQTGVGAEGWKIVGPPHRHRYLALEPPSEGGATPPHPGSDKNPALPSPMPSDAASLLALIRTHLLPSPAFRHFLANVTQLVPLGSRPVEVRRFRPGLDYTLARSDKEAVLDVNLCLTPDVGRIVMSAASGGLPAGLNRGRKGLAAARGKGGSSSGNPAAEAGLQKKTAKEHAGAWENGELGGWEAYLAPPEEGDDPAVYRSGGSGAKAEGGDVGEEEEVVELDGMDEDGADGDDDDGDEDEGEDDEMDEDEEEDEDFDGVLLHLSPSFNSLSIVLRDDGTMRFVKYLSAAAGGSRWDVCGEWEIGAVEVEDEDEGGDEKME